MDSPEGRQKMMGFGKEARHIFHPGGALGAPPHRSLTQRSMSVDFAAMANRRRKLSFPTDLTQITEELGDDILQVIKCNVYYSDEEYKKRVSDRTNRSGRSYFDDFEEEDGSLA